ncbi:MAG: beta-galactosidase [Kiritimatiellaeota bacterium]|nr:beta-galactosidase [Kiritimatiellota bacterium]
MKGMQKSMKVFEDQSYPRLLAGALHYFRVVPEYWEDRLKKLKYLGLNTVETYVPWNRHEPKPGKFVFSGGLDLEKFIRLAGALDLQVIVRPGPYICSEWDFGGLPSWLLANSEIRLRCANPLYLAAVDRYFDDLIPRLKRFQVASGGPLIAVQVENEYGSYGSDHEYLRYLAEGMRRRGLKLPFFTSDGPADHYLVGGTLPGVLKTVNFGNNAAGAFSKLKEHQPDGPLMCAEFWNQDLGGFLHWGEHRKPRAAGEVANIVDEILRAGASLNQYMFHGGTNFGFMNGANYDNGQYRPHITSYDHDGLLDEAGNPTPKYWAIREVIGKYAPLPKEPPPPALPKFAYGKVALTECASLFDVLESLSFPEKRVTPEPMEKLGQDYGFILYRTIVTGPREPMPLILQEVHDRAQVFVDGKYKGVIERWGIQDQLVLEFAAGDHQLDILVENMGRINFGPLLRDYKGITEGIRLGDQFIYHWQIFSLPLDDLSKLPFAPGIQLNGPVFCRGHFQVDNVADTFLALPGWIKGVCFINGFNLGRYWEVGPQMTLYLPAPLLRKGNNELIVLELHGMQTAAVEFRDKVEWK